MNPGQWDELAGGDAFAGARRLLTNANCWLPQGHAVYVGRFATARSKCYSNLSVLRTTCMHAVLNFSTTPRHLIPPLLTRPRI